MAKDRGEPLSDPCASVRDWAAFAVGVQRDVDTPQVRDALFGLLADDEEDTAGEAAVGLARRADPGRLIRSTRAWPALTSATCGSKPLPNPATIASCRFLLQLKSSGWQNEEPRPEVLDQAIERCSGTTTA
jgi:hypothetical protein